MVEGEASGDMLAALLLQAVHQRWAGVPAFGIGGPRMAEQGFDAWWPHHKLAVHGLGWEVLMRYREIVGIRKQLFARLEKNPPSLFIGVDAPDFNLELEAKLRARGVKTMHFVCPSVWAWRAERLLTMRRSVDHVLCLFPFEPALLAQHGIAATYVGHPLAQVIPMRVDRQASRQQLGLQPEDDVLALLPGSRRSEILHLAPVFFQAAARIAKARPKVKFVLPAVPGLETLINQAAQDSGMAGRVQIVSGQSHTVLAACDATLIASGTATLEAALFKRPMVIAYNMHWLSWQLMRRQRLQPWVGLPNILLQDRAVPELLQEQATPEAMALALEHWLNSPEQVLDLQQRFEQLHLTLTRDTPTLVTHAIQEILER